MSSLRMLKSKFNWILHFIISLEMYLSQQEISEQWLDVEEDAKHLSKQFYYSYISHMHLLEHKRFW